MRTLIATIALLVLAGSVDAGLFRKMKRTVVRTPTSVTVTRTVERG